MELGLIAAVVACIWYIASLRKEKKDLVAFSAADQAALWLAENDINGNVQFASYLGRPYSLMDNTVVLVGHGQDSKGNCVGFCAEVSSSMGFLGGILVQPSSIALNHAAAARACQSSALPLRAVFQHKMRQAAAKNSW